MDDNICRKEPDMAIIRSFGAYRPRTDIVDRVAALPYDVYNREEAYEEVKREPMSFLKVDRAETSFYLRWTHMQTAYMIRQESSLME